MNNQLDAGVFSRIVSFSYQNLKQLCKGLDSIAVVEFFSHRTGAHKGVTKWYPVTAGFIAHAFNKMDFIINAEFNPAKVPFTR